jgi:neutral amino acid transport system permease protein
MMKMLQDLRDQWLNAPRATKRIVIAFAIMLDSSMGLLYQNGLLNLLDWASGGGIPNDMVWLLQSIESISGAFFIVKILFDDVPAGYLRTLGIATSPLFLLLVVWVTLDFLFTGLGKDAAVTIDMATLVVGTLTWSSTYLAIAVGLTLTYKVQRYGNFAQSELFMIGMYLAMVMVWTDFFFPLHDAEGDGVLVWSLLVWTVLAAFVITGVAGVLIDRLVYRGFRDKGATPQIMMIASLGVALILRAIVYLRFGAGRNMFEPDGDWRLPTLRWDLPTQKLRFNLGVRDMEGGEPYTGYVCEAGERAIHEGGKPLFEIYGTMTDCATEYTTGYAYYKGAMPVVIFSSVLMLMVLLRKTRLGRRMRAVADNPDLAASSGINVERIQMTSAFLSAGISGMGGAIFAMTLRFAPETAFTLLLPSFAIIVLGTIGSIEGAIVAALIVGFVRSLSSPILIGIGLDLGRSNYTALDGVMPYIFLVAILMIMPEGIGDAYEKWKVERLRKIAGSGSDRSGKIAAVLALSPLGALGAHNFWQRKTARGESMLIVTAAAYFFSRVTRFISENSFAADSCSEACKEGSHLSNFQMVTGRTDGDFVLADSPLTKFDLLNQKSPPAEFSPFESEQWVAQAVSDMHESWLNLMNFELEFVELLVSFGDMIWPTVPIIVWLIAFAEGVYLLQGRKDDPLTPLVGRIDTLASSFTNLRNRVSIGFSDSIKPAQRSLEDFQARISTSLGGLKIPGEGLKAHYQKFTDWAPYGRESPNGSWALFSVMLVFLLLFVVWLPVADQEGARFIKALQISNVLITLSVFSLMAFSLNLHTGITGMVNFGVIFFVGIGAITVGILTAPKNLHGYDWPIFWAAVAGVMLAAAAGWLLAYPTARLRMDYFAIVTISLGEIVRVLLMGEPLLRAGSWGSSIGISRYKLPLQSWWFCGPEVPLKPPLPGPDALLGTADDLILEMTFDECSNVVGIGSPAERVGDFLNLGQAAPYMMVLAVIGVISLVLVWWMLETILKSPWGRILKAIREDEEVAQHHGHDVLTHKAASLALGAAIAALAGTLWAWKLTGYQPSFMAPAKSTFLVWAAFVVGGAANNRGMVIGAFIIVLMEFVFNVLVAGQGSSDLPLHETAAHIDSLFEWLVTQSMEVAAYFAIIAVIGIIIGWRGMSEVGFSGVIIMIFSGIMMDERSISESFIGGSLQADMAYVKVLLIGMMILFSLKYNPKGLLPEVPSRPPRPSGGESSD